MDNNSSDNTRPPSSSSITSLRPSTTFNGGNINSLTPSLFSRHSSFPTLGRGLSLSPPRRFRSLAISVSTDNSSGNTPPPSSYTITSSAAFNGGNFKSVTSSTSMDNGGGISPPLATFNGGNFSNRKALYAERVSEIGFGIKEIKLVAGLHGRGFYTVFVRSTSASTISTLNKELPSLHKKNLHPVVLSNAGISDGWGYEAFSESELAKYGVELPADAWEGMNRGAVVARRILGRLSQEDDPGERLSLIPDRYERSEYGSLVVTTEAGIGWTIVVEGSELGMITGDHAIDIYPGDGLGQNNPSVTFSCGKVLKVLYCPFYRMGKILCFAGEKVDSQIGAAITSVFGVGFSGAAANLDGKPLTHFDYVKIGAYALSCLLIICSWMLKPTPCGSSLASSSGAAASAKAKRCKKLSHLMAGGAIICTALGVFCNIFSAVALPYAISAISTCVVLVLLAAVYGSF